MARTNAGSTIVPTLASISRVGDWARDDVGGDDARYLRRVPTAGEERLDDAASEKPGGAGNEHVHGLSHVTVPRVANPLKVAIVTGAGSGIGKGVAHRAASPGIRGRARRTTPAAARGGHPGIGRGPGARAGRRRPTSAMPHRCGRLFDATRTTFGRLDLLFNNAGTNAPGVGLEDLTVEQWQAVVDVNLTGAVPVHAAGVSADESPAPDGRADHQQRIDLGACAATELRALHRDQARRSPASRNRRRSTAASTTSPAGRSTSATPRPT